MSTLRPCARYSRLVRAPCARARDIPAYREHPAPVRELFPLCASTLCPHSPCGMRPEHQHTARKVSAFGSARSVRGVSADVPCDAQSSERSAITAAQQPNLAHTAPRCTANSPPRPLSRIWFTQRRAVRRRRGCVASRQVCERSYRRGAQHLRGEGSATQPAGVGGWGLAAAARTVCSVLAATFRLAAFLCRRSPPSTEIPTSRCGPIRTKCLF